MEHYKWEKKYKKIPLNEATPEIAISQGTLVLGNFDSNLVSTKGSRKSWRQDFQHQGISWSYVLLSIHTILKMSKREKLGWHPISVNKYTMLETMKFWRQEPKNIIHSQDIFSSRSRHSQVWNNSENIMPLSPSWKKYLTTNSLKIKWIKMFKKIWEMKKLRILNTNWNYLTQTATCQGLEMGVLKVWLCAAKGRVRLETTPIKSVLTLGILPFSCPVIVFSWQVQEKYRGK